MQSGTWTAIGELDQCRSPCWAWGCAGLGWAARLLPQLAPAAGAAVGRQRRAPRPPAVRRSRSPLTPPLPRRPRDPCAGFPVTSAEARHRFYVFANWCCECAAPPLL